ncbi:SH3 domain-containing protein [Streptomyces sp. MNU76]|uniref:SH3 domain-containing protein n=1 Tax=Streptomyces sp. MNU76 TaxID=2560026 RepID=UPI001E59CF39|nr:SH3 domain-containing protein [Streptomyces sp. MNU76]MCC9706011.1 SH3 domain-containing protein [Streptomyces sp. MNU76]
MLGAIALPMLSATPASAAPVAAASTATNTVTPCRDLPPLPYKVHAPAVTIRSKAATKSTALGVLCKSHTFTVRKKSGNWLCITDKPAGVKGWVPGTYVYRDTRICLD